MNRSIRGFSLIELMVAAALTLLFMSLITALVINVTRVSTEVEQAGEIFENAQYTIGLLQDEIRLSGFYKQLEAVIPNSAVTRPELCRQMTAADIDYVLLYPVDGINNTSSGQRLCGRDNLMPQSDGLLLRRAVLPTISNQEQPQKWQQTIFYLSRDRSLKYRRFVDDKHKPSEPLVEGVDNFQLMYGLRSTGQATAAIEFVDLPNSEAQWRRLVAIRFYLFLSAGRGEARGVFTGISRLNNIAPKVVEFDVAI